MSVKPWQLGLMCRLSQKLLFWGKLHLKQNSVNKLLATVHGLYAQYVITHGITPFGYNREPMICKPRKCRKNILQKCLLYTQVTDRLPWRSTCFRTCTFTAM